jgi:hypothetical protein
LTLKQAADGTVHSFEWNDTALLRPNGYEGQAVLHVACPAKSRFAGRSRTNTNPNLAVLCEKLPCRPAMGQSTTLIQNYPEIVTMDGTDGTDEAPRR